MITRVEGQSMLRVMNRALVPKGSAMSSSRVIHVDAWLVLLA
jgi:hypothetical protein